MSDNFNFEEIKKDLMEHINQNKIGFLYLRKQLVITKKLGLSWKKYWNMRQKMQRR